MHLYAAFRIPNTQYNSLPRGLLGTHIVFHYTHLTFNLCRYGTDSALDLFDWLTLENISRDLFRINVRNTTYRRYHPFGAPQPWWGTVRVDFSLRMVYALSTHVYLTHSSKAPGFNP